MKRIDLPPINYENVADQDMVDIYMENQDMEQSDVSLYLALYDTILREDKCESRSFPCIIQTVNILKCALVKQYLEARAIKSTNIMQKEMK